MSSAKSDVSSSLRVEVHDRFAVALLPVLEHAAIQALAPGDAAFEEPEAQLGEAPGDATGFGDTGSQLASQDLGDEAETASAGEDLLRGAIGTPDKVREVLTRYEAAGVDQVIFLAQAGRTKHEHICESLESSPTR